MVYDWRLLQVKRKPAPMLIRQRRALIVRQLRGVCMAWPTVDA